jgi:hypothetical protein
MDIVNIFLLTLFLGWLHELNYLPVKYTHPHLVLGHRHVHVLVTKERDLCECLVTLDTLYKNQYVLDLRLIIRVL